MAALARLAGGSQTSPWWRWEISGADALLTEQKYQITRAAIRLKILIMINREIKIFNHD